MIGVDEHAYSDCALVWLLNNMVDDGDEIICVRVLESTLRPEKNYQDDAKRLLETIKSKNELNMPSASCWNIQLGSSMTHSSSCSGFTILPC